MSILDADFMRLAFAAGAIVGVVAPAVGFFLVQRRMSLIGDGIGHVAFAGVALGYLLGISPVGTALVASVLGAVAIEWLRTRRQAAGDQALALLFYTGIAAGVVLISAAGALNASLFSFLFGSILTVTHEDLLLVGVLGAVGLAVIAGLYRGLVAVALDEESARVQRRSGRPAQRGSSGARGRDGGGLDAHRGGPAHRRADGAARDRGRARRVERPLHDSRRDGHRPRLGRDRSDDRVLREPGAGRGDRPHGSGRGSAGQLLPPVSDWAAGPAPPRALRSPSSYGAMRPGVWLRSRPSRAR